MNHIGQTIEAKYLAKPSVSGNKITSVKAPYSSIEEDVIENNGALNSFQLQELAKQRFGNSSRVAINNKAYMVGGVLTLPKEVTSLIDNPVFMPLYLKLARIHGVNYLLKLAEIARLSAKEKPPSHYFARACSQRRGNWERETLPMLNKLFKKIDELKHKLTGVNYDHKYFYYYLKAYQNISESKLDKILTIVRKQGIDKPPNMLTWHIKQALSPKTQHEIT